MKEIRCRKCKAVLNIDETATVITCEFCGEEQERASDILCNCGGKIKFLGKCKDCGKWG